MKVTKKKIISLMDTAIVVAVGNAKSQAEARQFMAAGAIALALLERTRIDDLLGTSGRLSKGERARRDAMEAALKAEQP